MRLLVVVSQVVPVTGDNARDLEVLAEPHEPLINVSLDVPSVRSIWMPMVLHFKVVAIAKNALIPLGNLFCTFVIIVAETLAHFATGTTAEYNDSFTVFC